MSTVDNTLTTEDALSVAFSYLLSLKKTATRDADGNWIIGKKMGEAAFEGVLPIVQAAYLRSGEKPEE